MRCDCICGCCAAPITLRYHTLPRSVSPSQQSTHHHQRYTTSNRIRYQCKTIFNLFIFISAPKPGDDKVLHHSITPSLHTTATVPSIPDIKYKSISHPSLSKIQRPLQPPKRHRTDEVTSPLYPIRSSNTLLPAPIPSLLGSPVHAAPRCGLQTPIPKSHRFDSCPLALRG
ncbi:hypothetical protein DL98DRAFT_268115 [Cadophora sp. DSE1049]|nr:hypothetical protein DL98DRAFT_268115 [Cadophora sp. DSE1049]